MLCFSFVTFPRRREKVDIHSMISDTQVTQCIKITSIKQTFSWERDNNNEAGLDSRTFSTIVYVAEIRFDTLFSSS